MQDNFTINDLLAGNFSVYLELDWETIFQLAVGLVVAIVAANVLSAAILKRS